MADPSIEAPVSCVFIRCWSAALAVTLAVGLGCTSPPPSSTTTTTTADDPLLPGIENGDAALTARLRAAQGTSPGRSRHVDAAGAPRFINRLALERSPYLLQHANNPVNWFPWGAEAFERARREGKPVFVSIGYSTCHWCHVMERESFEDEAVAAVLNQRVIAIKVDREERPDLDDVYMDAVTMLTGRGGWPMTVLLTPDQQPFFGGTYFPAHDGDRGQGSIGLVSVITEMADRYRDDPVEVLKAAVNISRKMSESASRLTGLSSSSLPGPDVIRLAADRQRAAFDPVFGGFGEAPKFPRPVTLELLLRAYRRTGDAALLEAVTVTLARMHAGGIYDHVGGGFHRYATDRAWLVPHFEKMLYDNAQLAVAYLEAWQVTHNDDDARIVREVLTAMDRDLSDPRGGFQSASDADSRGRDGEDEEGLFFTWTPAEMDAVLGAEVGGRLQRFYGVTAAGNFDDGRSILHLAQPAGPPLTTSQRRAIDDARGALWQARQKRVAPLIDDKVLTAWNGLAISAFARAGFALNEPGLVARAARAATFLLDHHRQPDGALLRSSRGRDAHLGAYLDDYAFFIAGLLDLFEASGDGQWLSAALALQARLDADFGDAKGGGYFMTSQTHEALLLRKRPASDGAMPSGNSVAALNLLRLGALTLDDGFRARGEATIAGLGRSAPGAPMLLSALDFALDDTVEVVIVAATADAAAPMLDVLRRHFLPSRVLITRIGDAPVPQALATVVEDKVARGGRATAYVCAHGSCELPTTAPAALQRRMLRVRPLIPPSP